MAALARTIEYLASEHCFLSSSDMGSRRSYRELSDRPTIPRPLTGAEDRNIGRVGSLPPRTPNTDSSA
jgi:hypothetical protein